jgi:hypothetical protein
MASITIVHRIVARPQLLSLPQAARSVGGLTMISIPGKTRAPTSLPQEESPPYNPPQDPPEDPPPAYSQLEDGPPPYSLF